MSLNAYPPFDFFPAADVGIIKLHYRAPVGTKLEETEKLVLNVEERIRAIIPAAEAFRPLKDGGCPLVNG
jgi:multidrug efflux pump subunit AcrB